MLYCVKTKKNPATKCYPTKHWTHYLSHSGLMLSSLSHWGKCYLAELLLKWCRNKRQFKDILSSTCPSGLERRALDQNGWGSEFNAQWGNILLLDFFVFRFHIVKPVMPILPFLSILCVCEKLYLDTGWWQVIIFTTTFRLFINNELPTSTAKTVLLAMEIKLTS